MAKRRPKKQKVASKKTKSPAKKTLAVAGLSLRDQARTNRKHVLEALHAETGVWCGDEANGAVVKAYCENHLMASDEDFYAVGSLSLKRWYVDPTKPGNAERPGLWIAVRTRMQKPLSPAPGGWGSNTFVMALQRLAELTP